MPDQYVFELLRTMALQILQSAGFDSAHTDPTHVLTDIMGKYIEMLAATASAYAQLAGRAHPNPFDVMDSLHEVDIDLDTLREWLDDEGKALTPAWTAQSDPGRTIEGKHTLRIPVCAVLYCKEEYSLAVGFVGNGRPRYDDALVFEYREMEDNEVDEEGLEAADEEGEADEEEAAESADTEETEHPLSPPDQIPDTLYQEKQQEEKNLPSHIPPYMPPFPSDTKEEDQPAPQLPHLQHQQQQHPLHPALAHNSDAPAPIIVRNRRKPVDNPFTHVVSYEESMMATEKTTPALTLPSSSVEDAQDRRQPEEDRPNRNLPMKRALESLQTEPEQAKKARLGLSGNHTMFRQFTQDEAAPGNTMFTSSPGILGELLRRVAPPAMVSKLSSPNLLVDVAATQQYNALNGTPAHAVSAADKQTSSMLASLAGGQYNKKPDEPAAASSAQPTSTLPSSSEPNTTQSKQPSAPISLASLSAGAASSSSSSSKKKKLPKLMLNLSNGEAAAGGPASSSSADNTPVSTPSSAAPKIRFKIKPPEPAAAQPEAQSEPAPTSSSSSTAYSSAAPQPTSSAVSTPTAASSLPASTPTTATMAPAMPAATTTTTAAHTMLTPAVLPVEANSTEIIRCICDHPTVDYGAFMIACDQCGVWFHGNCVGIAESDQVEEWYCSSCRPASS